MENVLISIHPKYCSLIIRGEKTIELRKNKPKVDLPFRCYIYCTKNEFLTKSWYNDTTYIAPKSCKKQLENNGNTTLSGKIIGEFVCDTVLPISVEYSDPNNRIAQRDFPYICLTDRQIMDYLGNGVEGYGWHISNLKIYDKPKELSEFVVAGDCDCLNCYRCKWLERGNGYNVEDDCLLPYENDFKEPLKPLFRPPQSWCYVKML